MRYKKIEKIWFEIDQKIRFLLVGGFNTVASYLIFLGFFESLGINYNAALILQYVISVNLSIFTMRYYVFQSKKNFKKEYLKAWGTYVFVLMLNLLWLNVANKMIQIYPSVAQLVYVVCITIFTYWCHKNFSFCDKRN